jgi:hypothetical protein
VADQLPVAQQASMPLRSKPLIFISHDTRDAELAEAFGNLLTDVSTGTLKFFRSSDNKGTAGIEFGDDWYAAIIAKLREATDVVALLTPQSIDRPWILYEAGIAAGKLDTRVIGLAIGVPLSRAIIGPFGLFQKPTEDENSLIKLMMQLLQRNPDAAPREEAVRMHVRVFREKIEKILQEKGLGPQEDEETTAEQNITKLFEEVKEMVRDLPGRVDERVSIASRRLTTRGMRRIHPGIFEEISFHPIFREMKEGPAVAWLILLSMLQDDVPWVYEPGMELYRALRNRKRNEIEKARRQLMVVVELTVRSELFHRLFRGEEKDSFFIFRHLDEFVSRIVAGALSGPESDVGGAEANT